MTLTRNFPGRKYVRRMSALKRRAGNADRYELFLSEPPPGTSPELVASIERKLKLARKEMGVLVDSTAKGGKRATKKVGANTGGKWGIR